MTTRVTVTLLDPADPRQFTQSFYNGCRSAGDAWDWIARTIAEVFDVLPDDVGCDENPSDDDSRDLVTVNGEAVAAIEKDVLADANGNVIAVNGGVLLH